MDLRQAYLDARAAGHTRHRDIALSLGITEGMLIDAHVGAPAGGLQAQRLRRDFPALLSALGHAGEVMALTRNAHCVHERTGVYEQLSAQGEPGREMGMALGEEIDLRLFYSHWAHGYAVHESTPQGEQQSLQFFDARGVAVHKVFTRPGTHLAAWQALRIGWADPAAPAPQWRHEAPPAVVDAPDVNAGAFRAGWAALRDTHEFFGLLRKHGLTRRTAMHLAAPEFAQRVDPHAARVLLEGAAANGTPIMVFVGNPGIIQIHGGPIKRVAVMGPWLNVLDPRFNLHLREDAIAEAWAVRKPTVDGLVSSLELYAADGELIAQFFGQRKPGQPERCSWRQLLDGLVDDPSWCQQAAGCAA